MPSHAPLTEITRIPRPQGSLELCAARMADGHEITPAFIAEQFVLQYYSAMHKDPELVRKFYAADSALTHLEGNTHAAPIIGAQAIHEKITSLGMRGGMAQILHIDSQQSSDIGILIMLTGTFVRAGETTGKTFNQSFYLAKIDPNSQFSYYVRNNIFRYIDPDVIAPDTGTLLAKPTAAMSVAEPPAPTPEPEPVAPPALALETQPVAEPVVNALSTLSHDELVGEPAESTVEASAPPSAPMSWAARAAAAASKASAAGAIKAVTRPLPTAPVKTDGDSSDREDTTSGGACTASAPATTAPRPKEWGQGIFVRSVHPSIHDVDKLSAFFSKFGELKSLSCRDHGNAVVVFVAAAAAQAALTSFTNEADTFSLEGHRVRIEELRTFGERFPSSAGGVRGGRAPHSSRGSESRSGEARAGTNKGRGRSGDGGGRAPRTRPDADTRGATASK